MLGSQAGSLCKTSLGTQLCLEFSLKSKFTKLAIFKPSFEHYRYSNKFPDKNLRKIGPGFPQL